MNWVYPTVLSAVLLVISVILLVVYLVKQKKMEGLFEELKDIEEKTDGFYRKLDAEFERSRRELGEKQDRVRGELGYKIEQQKSENTERFVKLESGISNTLNEIKLANAEDNAKQSKAFSEAVEKMRESNEQKLEQMRLTVDEKLTETLTARLDSSFKTVSERLESVNKSLGEMKELSTGVTTNVTALNRVLTNVKARGTWAEVQLGAILDQTIPGMYETNFASFPGSSDRVEFAVRLPSNDGNVTYLPIDSKFPMEDYVRVCEAADAADAEALAAARKALEARVLNEAKTITKYINVPLTTPYAIMYLATEGLYAEITSSKSGIAERIQAEYNVMISGPSTVTALLNSLSFGYRAVAINEKANEVRALLAAAKQQYDKFGTVIQKAKKKIEEAGDVLDDAGKRNDIIRKKLGKIEEIDSGEAEELLGINEELQ